MENPPYERWDLVDDTPINFSIRLMGDEVIRREHLFRTLKGLARERVEHQCA